MRLRARTRLVGGQHRCDTPWESTRVGWEAHGIGALIVMLKLYESSSSCADVRWRVKKQWKDAQQSLPGCRRGGGHRKSDERQIKTFSLVCLHYLTESLFVPPPNVSLQLFFPVSVRDDSFVTAAVLRKHPVDPLVLQISHTKSPCVSQSA